MIRFTTIYSLVFIVVFTIGCEDKDTVSPKEVLASTVVQKPKSEPVKEVRANTIIWHWENRFEKEEVVQIKKWLNTVDKAITQSFGKYPFDMHFFIHRSKSGNEPVPWAHTTRGKDQGVHFHVNMDYSLQEFLDDWTAQHEISHLSIPFVGKRNAWFSEGYATYMQCQVMLKQGVMTSDEVKEKYANKLGNCKKAFQSNLPVPQAADSLKKAWNYPAMYWGGVSFFWKLNKQYVETINKPLHQVIAEYVTCCRMVEDDTPDAICKSLDKITGNSIASALLKEYKTQPARLMFEEF